MKQCVEVAEMMLEPQMAVAEKLGGFAVIGSRLSGIRVSTSPPHLVSRMSELEDQVRLSVRIEDLKADSTFRAYRDFFWRTGIDPTKVRPASEALTRRILRGKNLPLINSFVDALNIASVQTKTPFAAFDAGTLVLPLRLRYAVRGESMLPIGHREPISLQGKEIVISDEERVIALYPHRDSDETKITQGTTEAIVFSCGVPGLEPGLIRESLRSCTDTVVGYCGGVVDDI
jgi:DNA/RNA-binding domain of Phe-tRNA-synthetase-like protein